MDLRELLIQPLAYIGPVSATDGLSAADGDRHVDGLPHSIAEIVAHMTFWLEWFEQRCSGVATPMPAQAALGWPQVAPGTWPETRQRFLDVLERLVALGAQADRIDTPVTPPIEFPPLAHHTVRDVLVHAAQHNAHHLGQVIALRQVLGLWPPPGGGYTW